MAEQLYAAGVTDIKLKWPNDLQVKEEKLAGLLIEARGEIDGPSHAIIGLGLNLDAPAQAERIEQPWTCLARHLEPLPERNKLIAALLSAMVRACQLFQKEGLSPFLPRWKLYDGFQQRQVRIVSDSNIIEGCYLGLNENGGLLLQLDNGEVMTCHGGEVSLRGIG